jgi:hypothetical protein
VIERENRCSKDLASGQDRCRELLELCADSTEQRLRARSPAESALLQIGNTERDRKQWDVIPKSTE